MDNGDEIQKALATMTSQRTVPSVFIGEQHLGGMVDVHHILIEEQGFIL